MHILWSAKRIELSFSCAVNYLYDMILKAFAVLFEVYNIDDGVYKS